MPLVRINMFPGRSEEKKQELARELTNVFERVWGNNPESVTILFTETEKSDWFHAGEPYSKPKD